MNTYLTDSRLLTWPTKVPTSKLIVRCVVPGEPLSKQRPRLARNKNGNVYTPKQTVEAEMDIQVCIRAATISLFPNDINKFGVRCLFVQKNSQRRDIDNMLKLVLDACNHLVWEDDTQVSEIMALKQIDPDNPRTEIVIYQSTAPDAASRGCEYCGKA